MPFAGINRIVIHLLRSAKRQAPVGATGKHHVGRAPTARDHARQHVNVVFGGSGGLIDCEEALTIQSIWIDPSKTKEPTHVDGGALVKSRCLAGDLRIARANAPERAGSFTADKHV